jgi:hypothetical protein
MLAISALLVPVALFACGSSTNSGGGGNTGTGGHTGGSTGSTTSDTGSTTTTDTGSTTTSSATGSCTAACAAAHPAGYQAFQGYVLKECGGCGSDAGTAACSASCTAECADPTKLNGTSPCGACLTTEAGKGLGSTCVLTAATADCKDAECVAFLGCAQPCTN